MMNQTMQSIALGYLRRSPLDKWKHKLATRIEVPEENPFVHTTKSGLRYVIDTSDHVMRQIYLNSSYESNTQRHLHRLLRPNMTFFDVGANVGAYSLPAAKILTLGEVHSFEPNPGTAAILRKNLDLNELDNVKVEEVALSDSPGRMQLHFFNMTTASLHKHPSADQSVQVDVTTIDRYCEAKSIRSVDALKLDVEGHELPALSGAREVISRSTKMVLIVEVDNNVERTGHTRQDYLNTVTDLGFTAFLPRGWPRNLQRVTEIADNYGDNIVFLKGYDAR